MEAMAIYPEGITAISQRSSVSEHLRFTDRQEIRSCRDPRKFRCDPFGSWLSPLDDYTVDTHRGNRFSDELRFLYQLVQHVESGFRSRSLPGADCYG